MYLDRLMTAGAALTLGIAVPPMVASLQIARCAGASACIAASNTGGGPAVSGAAVKGFGVQGSSRGIAGVLGIGPPRGAAVAGLAKTGGYGVYGESDGTGTGVYGYGAKGAGVYGYSENDVGVVGSGTAPASFGVEGLGGGLGTGVYGSSQAATGVIGASDSSYGVDGTTRSGTGVFAKASGTGDAIFAQSFAGYGVVAYTNGQNALFARNANGNALDAGGSYIGVVARAPASVNTFPFAGLDDSGNDVFLVDGVGDISFNGTLGPILQSKRGAGIRAFGPTSSEPTVEDTGTGQLVDGVARVPFDGIFAASIDARSSYRVFLTPDGDTRGLYVAQKAAGGFVVREAQGGRSSLRFDYRIVATAAGRAGRRMAYIDGSALPHVANTAPRPRLEELPAQPRPAPPGAFARALGRQP
jgi:hypothetical protein